MERDSNDRWKQEQDEQEQQQSLSDFDIWWINEGSGMPPLRFEDAEEHTYRISKIAWENGAYKAKGKK